MYLYASNHHTSTVQVYTCNYRLFFYSFWQNIPTSLRMISLLSDNKSISLETPIGLTRMASCRSLPLLVSRIVSNFTVGHLTWKSYSCKIEFLLVQCIESGGSINLLQLIIFSLFFHGKKNLRINNRQTSKRESSSETFSCFLVNISVNWAPKSPGRLAGILDSSSRV